MGSEADRPLAPRQLNPNDALDFAVIRAAVRGYLCGPDAGADEVDQQADTLAVMIRQGFLTLEVQAGPDRDGRPGAWVISRFSDGETNRFRLDEHDLPPGILSEDA
jgi:hypothetical protein